jgi:DNA-binding response OmpR family regulator
VVDYEADIRGLIHDILTGCGYEGFTASSGEEGLTEAVSLRPDLIVLDVVMPGLSGLEVCRLVKSTPSLRRVRVLVLSALGRDVDKQLIEDAGADDYLRKPFSVKDLLSRVDELFRRENKQPAKAQNNL